MVVTYNEDTESLQINSATECDINDVMKLLGYRTLRGVFISGTAKVTMNSVKDLDIDPCFCITMGYNSELIVNAYPDYTFRRVVVSGGGSAQCTIINRVQSALFALRGLSKCTLSQPVETCAVESISATASLRIAGERITTTMCRIVGKSKDGQYHYINQVTDKSKYKSSSSSSSSSVDDDDEGNGGAAIPFALDVLHKKKKAKAKSQQQRLRMSLKPNARSSYPIEPAKAKPRLPDAILKRQHQQQQKRRRQ